MREAWGLSSPVAPIFDQRDRNSTDRGFSPVRNSATGSRRHDHGRGLGQDDGSTGDAGITTSNATQAGTVEGEGLDDYAQSHRRLQDRLETLKQRQLASPKRPPTDPRSRIESPLLRSYQQQQRACSLLAPEKPI